MAGDFCNAYFAGHPLPPLRDGAVQRKQPSGVHAVRLSCTSAWGQQWPSSVARCKAQPLAQAERQRQPTRPGQWCWSILHSPGLACYRRLPLSSHVRPRMPTVTDSSPFIEIQQRAQRGTSAFAAFCQHFRLWRGVRSPSPTPQRSASSNADRGASAPFAGSTASVKQSSGAHAVRLSAISARGEQWHSQLARCKA